VQQQCWIFTVCFLTRNLNNLALWGLEFKRFTVFLRCHQIFFSN
jgi:hypothetical protein